MSDRKNIVNLFLKFWKKEFLSFDSSVDGMELSHMIKRDLPYKIPNGYVQWNELADIFAMLFILRMIGQEKIKSERKNNIPPEFSNVAKLATEWFDVDATFPLFVVTPDLIDVFLKSNFLDNGDDFLKKLLDRIEIIYPNLLIVFPKNLKELHHETFGNIDHCFINFSNGENTEVVHYDDEGNPDRIVSYDTCCFWGSITTKYNAVSQSLVIDDAHSRLMNIQDEQDTNLTKIVLQTLLLISSKPELVINTNHVDLINQIDLRNSKGFGKKLVDKKKEKVFYPRVLNIDYTEKKIRDDDKNYRKSKNDNSYSQRPHWRIGYISDKKPYGKMKGVPKEEWLRKKIEVKSYLVRGNS